jgi:hypothetical protein
MGFVRKVTGVQGQIDTANRNADAQEAATRQSADMAAAASRDAAQAAATQQAQLAARNVVQEKVAEVASAPLDQAEVQLAETPTGSASGVARKRRAVYGTGAYSSGVSI